MKNPTDFGSSLLEYLEPEGKHIADCQWQSILLNIGIFLMSNNDVDTAMSVWKFIVVHDPSYAPAWYNISSNSRRLAVAALQKASSNDAMESMPESSRETIRIAWERELKKISYS